MGGILKYFVLPQKFKLLNNLSNILNVNLHFNFRCINSGTKSYTSLPKQ